MEVVTNPTTENVASAIAAVVRHIGDPFWATIDRDGTVRISARPINGPVVVEFDSDDDENYTHDAQVVLQELHAGLRELE